jgi:hypothetical protein
VKIWKYQFGGTVSMVWQMPKGAEILCMQLQGGKPCLWVMVDPSAPPEARWFQIHPTGSEIGPGKFDYIGTFQISEESGRSFVFHVFEVLNDH